MGNSQASAKTAPSNYGQIRIHLLKSNYFPEETIQGIVYINLIQTYKGNTLLLKLFTREFYYYGENLSGHIHHYKIDRITFSKDLILYAWPDLKIPTGQLAFPFNILLPSTLPGSFSNNLPDYIGEIAHLLQVELTPTASHQPKLEFNMPIIINEKIPLITSIQAISEAGVISCCCLNKGTTTIKATLEKNVFLPNEIVNIQIEFDNTNIQVDCQSISLSLIKIVKLGIRNFITTYAEMPLEKVLKGSKLIKTLNFQIPPINNGDAVSHGKFINCKFFLMIKAVMGACYKIHTLGLPIQILVKTALSAELTHPKEWNPTFMEVFNGNLGSVAETDFSPNLRQNMENQPMITIE